MPGGQPVLTLIHRPSRSKPRTFPYCEQPNPCRPTPLVSTSSERRPPSRYYVMPQRRSSIHKERHTRLRADLGSPGDRLPCPHFMVGRLQRRYSYAWLGHLRGECLPVDLPGSIDADLHRSTGGCSSMQYCGMLHGRVEHSAPDPPSGSSYSGQAGMDRCRAGSGQVELIRAYSDTLRKHRSGVVQQQSRGPSLVVQTGWIRPSGIHCRQQHFPGCRMEWFGRRGI